MPRNPNCQRCLLSALHPNTVCLYGVGPTDAKIMLVGEAPGADEDKHGEPFLGPAGRILNQALTEAGLDRKQVYISNVVKCRPPQNRTPSNDEADACLTYLLEEIESVRPAVVVALGNAPLRALTGLKAITKERGRVLSPRKGLRIDESVKLMATMHPAAELYKRGSAYLLIVGDLKMAAGMAYQREDRHTDAVYWATPGDESVTDVLYRLGQSRVLACDLEWTALATGKMTWPWAKGGEVFSLSLTGRVEGELLTVAVGWPPAGAVREELYDLLSTHDVVFHNAMADTLWTMHERLPVKLSGDTMILAYLLDELKRVKLETAVARYVPDFEQGWKGHLFKERPRTDSEWEELLTYNAKDTQATYRLMEGVASAVKASGRSVDILRLHKHLMIPATKVLAKAAYYGVPMDRPELERQYAEALARRAAVTERLSDLASVTPKQAATLAMSSDQTIDFIANHLGLPLNTSRQQELQDLVEYPAVQAILDYRSENKLISTYLEPWLTMLHRQTDDRLHSVYRLTSTMTGRLSTEAEIGGALQVTPREKWVRRLIRARPGRKILSADYATVEMRIGAWFANDETMLEVFNDPTSDIHRSTAAFMVAQREAHVSFEDYWPFRAQWESKIAKDSPERQSAKGVNFGLIFYMQPEKLRTYAWENYGVRMSLVEAQQAHAGYFRMYFNLPAWHERCMQQAQTLGYTMTPFGRKRGIEHDDVTKAINTPVQSTASDLTLLSMVQTDQRYRNERLDAKIVGFVHDSVLIDVSEKDVERAARILQDSMENVDTSLFEFTVPVPLRADTKIGDHWL